jgi:aldose 1-epimerase
MGLTITKSIFGEINNQVIYLFTLRNSNGYFVQVINYGARLFSYNIANKSEEFRNIVLNLPNLDEYIKDKFYVGATIGRVAGRIKDSTCLINNQIYELSQNNIDNTLHGGYAAISHQVWESTEHITATKIGIEFTIKSKHLDNGFPGNLTIQAFYWLDENNALTIEYKASTDITTIVNLTNHSYYNLGGAGTNILDHKIDLASDKYIEVNANLLPNGKIKDLEKSNYELKNFKAINQVLSSINYADIDLSYIIHPNSYALNMHLEDAGVGIKFFTNQNTLQIFTSQRLEDIVDNKLMKTQSFAAIAIEPQNYLDAIHHKNFPSIILQPNQQYFNLIRIEPYVI